VRLQAIDKRYLEILEVGGPRKPRILRHAFEVTDAEFNASIRRLRAARLIRSQRRQGGPHLAIARRRHVRD